MNDNALYIASDLHLGVPNYQDSLEREKKFVRWLDYILPSTAKLILLGDVFDFWFEYKYVVPKGYIRLFAKILEFTDNNIPVHFFVGNHDLWLKSYLVEYLGVKVHYDAVIKTVGSKRYYLAHGDGLGPGDKGYKLMKKLFTNKTLIKIFSCLHPTLAFKFANAFSATSANASRKHNDIDYGDKERLYQYAVSQSQNPLTNCDYYIFGHRHRPIFRTLPAGNKLLVLGDWIEDYSYIKIFNDEPSLLNFK